MALKDFWRGFWSTDYFSNVDYDSAQLGNLSITGTGTQPAIISPGRPNSARAYNGTTDTNVVLNSNTNMSFTNGVADFPFGWCCFVFLNSLGVNHVIFSKNNVLTPTFEWDVTISTANKLVFRVIHPSIQTNNLTITSTNTIPISTWTMFAGDYNGNKTASAMRLFVNGVLDSTAVKVMNGTYTGMLSSAVPLKIGATISGSTYQNFLVGRLDTIGVRATLWGASEPDTIYNSGKGMNPFTAKGTSMMNFF